MLSKRSKAATPGRRRVLTPISPARRAGRWLLSTAYAAAAAFHLATPGAFMLIMPDWVPYKRQVILGTGLCELAGAAALATRSLRRLAGSALALYAVCVFPANIKHALHGLPPGHIQLGWWYHAPRLALQPVLVWWALYAGEVIDWPFRRSRGR